MLYKAKKLLFLLGVPILGLMLLTSKPVYASGSVTAFIVLRCTVTISVSLVAGNTWFNFGDISAAATRYSDTPIIFRNDSHGAICMWDLNIEAASLDGWTLANAPGLNQIALFGLFRKTTPTSAHFDVVSDTFSVTAKEYNAINFHDAEYDPHGHGNGAWRIFPRAFADTVGRSPDRRLWLKIQTPTCVTDQNRRTLQLRVTAKMAN
ncbi:MAG: hypothetical protein DDT19_01561 [Syntrophomonadaceae bacterium]|nr:hypothetical protein [Bacillota bacterium]